MATLMYPDLIAIAEQRLIEGTAGNDLIMVLGDMRSEQNGRNIIDAGAGDNNIIINGRLTSQNSLWPNGNLIQTGNGSNVVVLNQGAEAGKNGHNQIEFSGGADTSSELIINGQVTASGGSNNFSFGEGHAAVETQGWHASEEGSNHVVMRAKGSVTISGSMIATDGDNNITISAFDDYGPKDSLIYIDGDLIAINGSNGIYSNSRAEYVITGSVVADEGTNYLSNGQSNGEPLSINIGGDVLATNKGSNYIEINSMLNELVIGGSLSAVGDNSLNDILMRTMGNGPAYLEVNGGLITESGTNTITIGALGGSEASHAQIYISGHLQGIEQDGNALVANGGINELQIRAPANINIDGGVEATNGGNNLITMMEGNDHLSLNGKITAGALDVDLGAGYDVLTLQSSSHTSFAGNYQAWLTETSVADMNVEALLVNLGRPTSNALNNLDWLEQLVSEHNATSDNDIELRLDIDRAGNLDLSDLFSGSRDDIFSGLDMSGRFSNQLTIDGSFADNDMDGEFLRVLGDGNDSVRLSDNWALVQNGYTDETGLVYDRYTNATDELLIQSNISVV